jgi:3-oxoacyl-[acyl-carrier-protein] synthase-3
MGCEIAGLGHYAPERRVSSAEIETRLGLEAGWIVRRTGIAERRFAADDEALSDMAVRAGEMALTNAGLRREDIALCILATSTPDHLLPPTGPLVAHRLALTNAGAIDMAGACSGYLYALTFADSFVRAQGKPVLVIAANILSRRINPAERASSVLFADAAGAAVLAPSTRAGTGVLGVKLAAQGSGYELIHIPAGGSRRPLTEGMPLSEMLMTIVDGRAVYTRAVDLMAETAETAMAAAAVTTRDITHFIPHQANTRMIGSLSRKLGIGDDRTLTSIAEFGNSSAATIPFTMSLRAGERAYKPGDRVLMCAAGAGLTGGAIVFGM